jgi:hypothetical protein
MLFRISKNDITPMTKLRNKYSLIFYVAGVHIKVNLLFSPEVVRIYVSSEKEKRSIYKRNFCISVLLPLCVFVYPDFLCIY